MPYIAVDNSGWNAGARSRKFCAGDCQLEFSVLPTVVGVCAGVNTNDREPTLTDIPYSFLFQKAGGVATAFVYEAGLQKFTVGPYIASDKFTIRRTGTTIRYLKNNVVVYTSLVPSTGILYVDTSLFAAGDKL